MIRAVRCDRPQFKTVTFQPGFNVLIAERTKESTKKDSRNGLGKTTLVEIIHFCLGASAKKGQGLLREPLLGWTFSLDMDLKGQPYTIHRNTEHPGRVFIEGDCSLWPVTPSMDPATKEKYLSVREWNMALGWMVFGLPLPTADEKYLPSFRSLISYFIRRGRDAFSDPFEHYRKQMEWDKQVNNAFLLGLGWEYAAKWQLIKDKEKTLDHLKKAAASGLMPNLVGTIGELESAKVRLEENLALGQHQLASFKVHARYRDIEENANALTAKIHKLVNENVVDGRFLRFYESSLAEERPATREAVSGMYEEAGIALPGVVLKRLQDVWEFHQRITANRKNFLQGELLRLKDALSVREQDIQKLSDERAGLLSILKTHGALEEYNKLQQGLSEMASRLEEIRMRIENLRKFKVGKSALNLEKDQLELDAIADYEDRQTARQRAISLFNANTEALYEAPGKLIIDISSKGFKYEVEIERSPSQGVGQMKVFSYDLMLARLWAEKGTGPEFLIHDSTIFDGVDERQRANAIQQAAREAERCHFQYICCLNSDLIPWNDFDQDFDLSQYKRLELTDAKEDGGLLGMRF